MKNSPCSGEASSRPAHLRIALLIVALLMPLAYYYAHQRLIAGDEGFYLMAAQLCARGKLPYLDFFYPQMPLLPFAMALWGNFFGTSWEAGRALCALCGACMAGALWYSLRAYTLAQLRGALATRYATYILFLFCLSPMSFPWLLSVKTYAVSGLLLLVAFCLLQAARKATTATQRYWLAASGACFAGAFQTRLPLLGLAPVFMLYAASPLSQPSIALRRLCFFSLGVIFCALPSMALACADFQAFWFNNIGYHLMRADSDTSSSKLQILGILLGVVPSTQLQNLPFAALVWLAFAATCYHLRVQKSISLAQALWLGLGLIHFLPTPSYLQYFCYLVPYLLISILEGALLLASRLACASSIKPASRSRREAGLLGFVLLYIALAWPDVPRYLPGGEGSIGNPALRSLSPRSLAPLDLWLEQHTSHTQQVFASWPGYLVGSARLPYPGMENHFGIAIARKLPPDLRSRYLLPPDSTLSKLLAYYEPPLIVLMEHEAQSLLRSKIGGKKYQQVLRFPGGRVLQRREPAAEPGEL
jgi:hypothetical protein